MKFPVIQTDGEGETHFGVRDTPVREVPFGPPPAGVLNVCRLAAPLSILREPR
jgi:hypothetical protein